MMRSICVLELEYIRLNILSLPWSCVCGVSCLQGMRSKPLGKLPDQAQVAWALALIVALASRLQKISHRTEEIHGA